MSIRDIDIIVYVVCMYCTRMMPRLMCRNQRTNFIKLILSSHLYMGSKNKTLVFRFAQKCLYPLGILLTPGSVFNGRSASKTPGFREVIMNFCVALLSGSQLHILTKSLRRVGRQTQCLPGDFIELRSVMCFTSPGIVQAHSDCICMFLRAVC